MKWNRVINLLLVILVVGSVVFEPSAKIYADQLTSKKPMIYTGGNFSGVIDSDGTIWSWGSNSYRQLGREEATLADDPFPKKASSVTVKPVQISGSSRSTLALNSEGEIMAWGSNGNGWLGIGDLDGKIPSPVLVNSNLRLSNVISIHGGTYNAFAIRGDGTVWSWGDNVNGLMGNGINSGSEKYATQVKGPNGAGYLTSITSLVSGTSHIVAVSKDGTLWAWGDHGAGSLGVAGSNITRSFFPVHLGANFNKIKDVSAGTYFTVALKSDGTVWSWGLNNEGQLGDGTRQTRSAPVQVVGQYGKGFLDQVVAIESGDKHTLALRADGTVWSWGSNSSGQAGIKWNSYSNSPMKLEFKNTLGKSVKIQSISTRSNHSVALSVDNELFTWGDNSNGQLGVGDKVNRTSPVQVDWHDSITISEPAYTTSYVYDSNGRLLRKTISRKDGVASTYQYTYDRNGNLKNTQIIKP
ncbi:MAG: hypothetical protein ACE3K2_16415 [Paenibacillus sp.]|uniref:RCC1 domain-containing protein n=1 Tax=Paenibacillus TaxID=44249 RepID=UPI003B81FEFC